MPLALVEPTRQHGFTIRGNGLTLFRTRDIGKKRAKQFWSRWCFSEQLEGQAHGLRSDFTLFSF